MKTKEELREDIKTLTEENENLQNILSRKNTYIENLERDSKFWGSAKIDIFRDGKTVQTIEIDEPIFEAHEINEIFSVCDKLYNIEETNAQKEISYKITLKDGYLL